MSSADRLEIGAARLSPGVARLDTALAIAMAGFILLVPIPAASNRPVLWAVTGAVVALLGVWYAFGLIRAGSPPRFGLRQIAAHVALTGLILAFLAMQVVPWVGWLGAAGVPISSLVGPIASPAISIAPGATLLCLLQWASYAMFFYLMLQVSANRDRAAWLIQAVFYIIAAHAAYAIVALTQLGDPILIFEKWAYEGVATGTFVNRNSFATFVAFGLVVGLSLLLRDAEAYLQARREGPRIGRNTNWSRIMINLVAMLVLAAALIASQSRGGALAAAVGCVAVLAAFVARRRATGARGIAIYFLGALVVGVGTLALYGGGLLERVGSLEANSDVDVRTSLYQQVIGMIGERPWFGYGGGAFEAAFPWFHRLPVSADVVWDKAHSTYLALWAEMGLVGGTIPLILIAVTGWTLLRSATSRQRDWALPMAGFGVIVAAATHSLVDFSLEIQANVFTFLAIVALGMTGALAPRQRIAPAKTQQTSESEW